MRLMCWDIDIVHRNVSHLVDANNWSQIGADICFDPLFKSYLDFNRGLCEHFPAPTTLLRTQEYAILLRTKDKFKDKHD
jgi:hypothetical protein